MNLNITEEFNLTEDVQDIERRFWSFYLTVIKDYFDLDEDFICLEKEAPNHGNNTKRKKNYRIFNQPDELLRFCIQDTCLGLRKFYASFVNYIEIFNYLSKKNLITIYCVLGKSLFAALGICIVIDEAVKQYGVSHGTNKKQIELIVTEIEKNWRNICVYVVGRINSCYKNVEIKLEFIDDYSTRLSVEAFRAIKEVDIVVMSRYLSHFPYLTVRTHFLEVILKRMKERSILFYLDSQHEIYYSTLKHLILKTDSLIEVKSQETMYELFEDAGSEEYCLEFSFLYTTGFEKVIFSICIKCHGIKDNSCFQNNIKEDMSSFRNSERDSKLKICDRFKKENSLPSPEVKYIFISSKSFSDVADGKTDEKIASGRRNLMKSSKNIDDVNIPPKILQVTTFRKKNKKKPPNEPKDGNPFTPSATSIEFEEGNTSNEEIIKTKKDVDILASQIPQNKYAYISEEMKQPPKSVKTTNIKEKLFPTNIQNNYKYSKEEKKPSAKTKKASNVDEKLSFTNLQNNCKHSKEEKKPSAKTDKTSNVQKKLSFTNLQNNCKHSKEEKKPSAKIAKTSKVVEKLSFTNLQNNYKYSKKEKKSSLKIDRTSNLDEKIFPNLQQNNKYSKEEKKPFATAVKTSNVDEKLSIVNLQNNYKYCKEENKPSVKTDKTSNFDEEIFTNLQNNKYSKEEEKLFAKAAKTSNVDEKLSSTNLHNNYKYFEKEEKPSAKTTKTSNFVEKLAFTNSQNKCKYSRRKKKSNAETGKTAIENLTSTNLRNENKYFKEEKKRNFETIKSNRAGLPYTYPRNKYKYLEGKKKLNAETVKTNKVVRKFHFVHLQVKCKYSGEEEKSNVETRKTSKAVQKLASTKQQSKNEYKCPHLRTAESVSNYAELLSEIYYFKHFGKKSKYFSVYS